MAVVRHEIFFSDSQVQGCFNIQHSLGAGTAFLFHTGRGSILFTAKHILENAVVGDYLLVKTLDSWWRTEIIDLRFDLSGYDLCAFALNDLNVYPRAPRTKDTSEGFVVLGCELKFLGYPHGMENSYPGQGFPTPLVRTAFFSGVTNIGGLSHVILDGFNNPGYSGGPVYSASPEGEPRLFGLISGYRYELKRHGRIFRQDEDGNEIAIPDLYTKPNSGMIYCIPTEPILSLAASATVFNPEGEPPKA